MINTMSGPGSPAAMRAATARLSQSRMAANRSAGVGVGMGTALVRQNDEIGQVKMTPVRGRSAMAGPGLAVGSRTAW